MSSHSARNLPYAAGFAVAYGLPYDDALKAITLNVAEMFGFGDKLGSLDVGKMANVVVANGDPLDVRTDVKQVYIQGVARADGEPADAAAGRVQQVAAESSS